MPRFTIRTLPTVIMLLIFACGCGGGGGSSSPYFGGTYAGTVTLKSETCNGTPALFGDISIDVTQNEDDTLLLSYNDILHGPGFPGEIISDSSFSGTRLQLDGDCLIEDLLNFTSVTNDSANLTQSRSISCPKGKCAILWSGTLGRK